jgi:N utilization substance protein B
VGKRSKARECAFQILYQWESTNERIEAVLNSFWKIRNATEAARALADRLAHGAHRELEAIDAQIDRAARNWRLERIASVDRNILRVGAYELMQEPATPTSVIIDEAIEMAKRFGERDSPAFVNGVLDAIARSVRPGALGAAAQPKRKRKARET